MDLAWIVNLGFSLPNGSPERPRFAHNPDSFDKSCKGRFRLEF